MYDWKNKKDKATRGIVQYCSQWPKWDQNDKWSKWDQMKFSRSRSEIFLRGVFTVCAVTLETKTQWTCKWARAIVESHHTVNAEIVLLVVMTSAEIDSVVVLKRNDVIVQKKLVRLRSAINRAWQSDQWPREENRHELDNKELVMEACWQGKKIESWLKDERPNGSNWTRTERGTEDYFISINAMLFLVFFFLFFFGGGRGFFYFLYFAQ